MRRNAQPLVFLGTLLVALTAVAVPASHQPIRIYYVQVDAFDSWNGTVVEGARAQNVWACSIDQAPTVGAVGSTTEYLQGFDGDGVADLFHPSLGEYAQVHDFSPESIREAAAKMRQAGYWSSSRRPGTGYVGCPGGLTEQEISRLLHG